MRLMRGFAAATGFTSGKLGGATAGGSAVEVGASGACKPTSTKPEKSEARGTIRALSASSVTVAGLSCAIPADKSAEINAKFKQGDTASIECSFANGQNTLRKIEKKH